MMRYSLEFFFTKLYRVCSDMPEELRKVYNEIDKFKEYIEEKYANTEILNQNNLNEVDVKINFGFEILNNDNFKKIILEKLRNYLFEIERRSFLRFRGFNFKFIIDELKLERVNINFISIRFEKILLFFLEILEKKEEEKYYFSYNNLSKRNNFIDVFENVIYFINYKHNIEFQKKIYIIDSFEFKNMNKNLNNCEKIIILRKELFSDELKEFLNNLHEVKYKITHIYILNKKIEAIVLDYEKVKNYNFDTKIIVDYYENYIVNLEKYILNNFDLDLTLALDVDLKKSFEENYSKFKSYKNRVDDKLLKFLEE